MYWDFEAAAHKYSTVIGFNFTECQLLFNVFVNRRKRERPWHAKIMGSPLISSLFFGLQNTQTCCTKHFLPFSLMKYGFVYRRAQMLIIVQVCLYVCACVKFLWLCVKYVYVYADTCACVCCQAELDLGSEARKGRDAWRNLAMRLINSLATQSRFIK